MNISNRDIADNLEEIFIELNDSEFLINPFLRISKATPEQMQNYRTVTYRFPRLISLLCLTPLLISSILNLLSFCLLSVIFSYQYLNWKSRVGKVQNIFLSHAIGENITTRKGDQFFALMPEYFYKRGINSTIIYTNHNKFKYLKIRNQLSAKNQNINSCLIPKFLKPKENLEFIVKTFHLFFICLIFSISKFQSDPKKSTLSIMALPHFFSRGSYNNYLLLKRIMDHCILNPKINIFLTFEGHSYEHYLIGHLNKSQPKTRIILYQHSPIVLDHFGIVYFLRSSVKNMKILTTGILYQKYFESISKNITCQVVGSNKVSFSNYNSMVSKKKSILITPEGTSKTTYSFFKLAKFLAKHDSKHEIVFRLHPNLRRNLFLTFSIFISRKQKNLTISSNTLNKDLENSILVFYRSSAVGVQTLISDASPVFYSESNQKGLNVLWFYAQRFYSINNYSEALNLIQTWKPKVANIENKILYRKMLTKIQYSVLDKL